MRQIEFWGASDDLVEVRVSDNPRPDEPEEVGVYDTAAEFKVAAPDGAGMFVCVHFLRHGCWSVGIGQLSEGEPLPDWPLEWDTYHYAGHDPHTVRLKIEAPDDATITLVHPLPED